jgi:hypothetical protein
MTIIGEQRPARDEAWRQLECTCLPDRPEMSYTPGCPRCEGWSAWMGTTFAGRNFHGHGGACGEHRTVGECRAYCLQCSEWCYPNAACKGCAHLTGQEWP